MNELMRRRRALMAQAKEIPVFHWDKSLGTSGLTFTGTATTPSVDSTGLKVPYGPSWKSNSVIPPQSAIGNLVFEVEISNFDYSVYSGDISFNLSFNGMYSRFLRNSANSNWNIYNGETNLQIGWQTKKAAFTIRCEFKSGTASWYVDDVLAGSQAVGQSPPNRRIFAAECGGTNIPEKTLYITRIDIWEVAT